MIKILLVDSAIDPVSGGGTGERTSQLSRFLAQAGADCTILTLDIGKTRQRIGELTGVKVVALPCLSRRFYLPGFSRRQIYRMVADADVVHLMGHWTFLNAMVSSLARYLDRPYVVCPAGALPIFGRSRLLKELYNGLVGRRIIRNANAYVAITAVEGEQFVRYGVDADAVDVIPNGVDPDGFADADDTAFRARHGLGVMPFLLFMGRLNPIKGPDLLLQAFCSLGVGYAGYELVFAGPDGGMLAQLQETVIQRGLERRVHFLGYLDQREKSQAYHAAKCLVIPSRQEAMSLVVLEAGICGTPALITDQCGFNELATLGGGVVVAASVAGLTDGLVTLLDDGDALAHMGNRLKKYTRSHYLWSQVARRYLRLFETLVSKEK